MAKEIISMGEVQSGTSLVFSVLFWFPISSGAKTQANGSQWSGASTAENTAIQNGTVLEVPSTLSVPVGTPIATIKSLLQSQWTEMNSQINGVGPANTSGVFFDSVTGWSA